MNWFSLLNDIIEYNSDQRNVSSTGSSQNSLLDEADTWAKVHFLGGGQDDLI